MFATSGPRCPVQLFKQYLSRRPLEFRDKGPFYLAVIDNPKTKVWYKKQRLGVNSIEQMMKNTPLETSSQLLSNHSARKTVVKKLRAANVERQSITQVTGHANEKSLNDYDEGTERERRELSHNKDFKIHYGEVLLRLREVKITSGDVSTCVALRLSSRSMLFYYGKVLCLE